MPVVYGCSHACTFCIIPFRRGVERSRPVGDIVAEVRSLAAQGVKEVTLLGQIVDRYGKDVPDGPNLAGLLRVVHEVEGIERIRFLTSHPNYFGDELMDAVAELPKVMPHIEVPIQAGRRRGAGEHEARLHPAGLPRPGGEDPRAASRAAPSPPISSSASPARRRSSSWRPIDVLADLKLDVAHLARYSSREGTVATRRMDDNVPRRREDAPLPPAGRAAGSRSWPRSTANISVETVEVLFEEKVKNRWRGRTPTNKLVFVESEEDLRGKILPVTVTWTGPWSMQANLQKQPELISI